jgi:PhnB protein
MKKAAKKKKVDPVPKNYPVLSPYLCIKGAAAAIDFYKKAFGAKERMRMPMPGGMIGHCEIQIGAALFMLADEFPNCGAASPATLNGSTTTMMVYVKDIDKTFAQAIAAGATQVMAPMDMFYGDRSGTLKDPFGHVWMFASHIEDVPLKEMMKRSKEAMEKMAAGKALPS